MHVVGHSTKMKRIDYKWGALAKTPAIMFVIELPRPQADSPSGAGTGPSLERSLVGLPLSYWLMSVDWLATQRQAPSSKTQVSVKRPRRI